MAVQPTLEPDQSAGIAVRLPDGRREIVAWIKDFEPEFPTTYRLRVPLVLPPGSVIATEARGHVRDHAHGCGTSMTNARRHDRSPALKLHPHLVAAGRGKDRSRRSPSDPLVATPSGCACIAAVSVLIDDEQVSGRAEVRLEIGDRAGPSRRRRRGIARGVSRRGTGDDGVHPDPKAASDLLGWRGELSGRGRRAAPV